MAYLAEFAAAAAVAAAALVPAAALTRSAALNAAETKCYTVANGLTKALYEHRTNRQLMERGMGTLGDDGSNPYGSPGVHWSGLVDPSLHSELWADALTVLGDLTGADPNGIVQDFGATSGAPKALLVSSYLVLLEFLPSGNDIAVVRTSTVRMKPGHAQYPSLNQTNGVYNDFVIVKSVTQHWTRMPDGRITFTRPYSVTPQMSFEP